VRKVYLKLKSYDRFPTLLNRNLLSNKTQLTTLHPDEEIGFSRKADFLEKKFLLQTTTTNCLSFIQTNIASSTNQLTIPHFTQNYYPHHKTPNLLWYATFPLTLTLSNLNTTFNSFFYKNLQLIHQLNGSFNQKLFYQNHFFTNNRGNFAPSVFTQKVHVKPSVMRNSQFQTFNLKR
jgi:hypothetical protein